MATIRVPITFTQFSPYVAGTVTVRWFDSDAVSAVTDFASGTSGISSNTLSTSAATFTVVFASTSSSGSDVDLTTAFNGSTGIGLTIPNDYNENITVEVEIDANVGATSGALTPLKKTIRHQVLGVSDSTFTSSPATIQHNETEAAAGTTKSLGTYSINDTDSGANYTVNITYDKTIGSITYNDTSFLNTSASDKDVLTTTNVTNLNSVLSDLQYKPLFIATPGTNQNALQGQTITISISSDKDNKINNGTVTVSPTIDNTLQFSNSGPAPAFNEHEGSAFDATGKSLGTIGISPTFTQPGVTFTATITYDKAKGSITYPDSSIVTSFTNRDEIATNNITTLNTALSSSTYLPTSIASGTDLERIEADTLAISVASSPSLVIANPTTSVTTTVTNQTPEFSGEQAFGYVENTKSTNVLPSLVIGDTADNDAGTTEIYAVVIDPSANVGDLVINGTTNIHTYSGTGAEANISANAYIVQGSKANVNTALTSAFNFFPHPNVISDAVYNIDVYRAPDGTSLTHDINTNYSTFKQIYSGNNFAISNTGTVDNLVVSSNVTITEDSVSYNNSMPSTTITADSTGNRAIDLSVTVSTTASLGNGAGEFGELFVPYIGVSGTTSGGGSGATFNLRKSGNNYVGYASGSVGHLSNGVNQAGSGYSFADTITIAGTDLGGTSPANDCTITVTLQGGGGLILDFSVSGTANNEWNSSTGVLSFTGTQSEIDDFTANLKYQPGTDTITDSTLTYQIQVQGQTQTHSEVRAIDITPVQEAGSITLLTDDLMIYDSNNYKSGTPFEFGFNITDPDTANVSSNITATVSLSHDIGTLSSTAGTFDSSTRDWTYTDSLSNVNTALANMDLNLHSNATVTATISANYVDNQDPGTPVSASLNNAITVRDLDYDPVYMGTRYYQSSGAVDSNPGTRWFDSYNNQTYVYTDTNSVDVYYDYDSSSNTWNKKDTYDISDISSVSMTTDTSGNLTPFANVYANYTGSSAATDRVLDNNVIKWLGTIDRGEYNINGQLPWWGTQYARGETDGNKDSYWYLIPHRATQNDFTTNYPNTLGVDAIQFNGQTEKSQIKFGVGPRGGTYEQTMSFWVKPNFSGTDVQEQVICEGTNSNRNFVVFMTYNNSATGVIDFYVDLNNSSSGTGLYRFFANNSLNNNAWNHVVWSIDVESGATQGPSLAINDAAVTPTLNNSPTLPSQLADSNSVTWGCENTVGYNQTYTKFFDGCLAEVVGYNIYLDTSNVTNRRKFITASGSPATINTSDTGISAYIHGGAETWNDQLNPSSTQRFNNIDDCPPQTLFQSNGSVVVGDFVGADGDCVYDTNPSSGTYQQYTSSQTGFNPPVSTEPSQIGFYRFGSPSNGTPTYAGADRDLTYYLSATNDPSVGSNENFLTEVRAQTSSTNIQLLAAAPGNLEFSLSGDDTTERVAVAFNDTTTSNNDNFVFVNDNDRVGELRIMDTSNYGSSPLRSIRLSTTPVKVNHDTFTFSTEPSTGEGPHWRSHGHGGSNHWFFNNVIAMIDNSGRLVIYKKN